nr:MAG TPA: hypothetical protein [Caudoviricetes sp.]
MEYSLITYIFAIRILIETTINNNYNMPTL